MDCATKEEQVWIECWAYMALWMQTGLEIWIVDKIQAGMCVNLFGGSINWMRKRQYAVALSTIEVEYMATTHASKETIWLRILCSGIGLVQQVVRINCDNYSAIFLGEEPSLLFKDKAY
jgi:hypothetical protein